MSNADEELSRILRAGLKALNLNVPSAQQEKILEYVALLHKWNKTYNLTAIRDPKSILIRNVFDSLAIAPFILGPNVLDFGTGAGLPGIPLAIVFPEYHFILLDSSKKKTTFLNHVVYSLKIKNVQVSTGRIEAFRFAAGFATIVTRATVSVKELFDLTKHLSASGGQILAMKGKYPAKELAEISDAVEVYRLDVPHLKEERHLVKIC